MRRPDARPIFSAAVTLSPQLLLRAPSSWLRRLRDGLPTSSVPRPGADARHPRRARRTDGLSGKLAGRRSVAGARTASPASSPAAGTTSPDSGVLLRVALSGADGRARLK
ncbi:unnamed protein product [Urochloa humidicola]